MKTRTLASTVIIVAPERHPSPFPRMHLQSRYVVLPGEASRVSVVVVRDNQQGGEDKMGQQE